MGVNGSDSTGQPDDVVVRKAERGWVVGDENVSDLTSAMVLADLFAADQADDDAAEVQRIPPTPGAPGLADQPGEAGEAARLAVTVAQLEHALAARVRVEQAIGVLAGRHRLRPREAVGLLRQASRARGAWGTERAQD